MKSLFKYLFTFLVLALLSCEESKKETVQQEIDTLHNKVDPSFELHFYRSNAEGKLETSVYKRIPEQAYYEWIVMLNDSTQRILTSDAGKETAYLNGDIADSTYEYWKDWNSFFEFMLNIPDGIHLDQNAIKEPLKDTLIDNIEYKFIRVTYLESIGSHIWYYYYQNNEFKFCDFYFDENFSGGERVVFKGNQKFQGKELSKIWEWYHMPDGEFLYTDTLKYINPIGDE